jgi:hypothetical protein
MGIEGVANLSSNWQNSGSDGVERETSLAERERKDKEKAEEIRERQVRLGHVPAPEGEESEEEK